MRYRYAIMALVLCIYPWTTSSGNIGERAASAPAVTFDQVIQGSAGLSNNEASRSGPLRTRDGLTTGSEAKQGLWTLGQSSRDKQPDKPLMLARSWRSHYSIGSGRYSAVYFGSSYPRSVRYHRKHGKRYYSRGCYGSYCGRSYRSYKRLYGRSKYYYGYIGMGRGKYYRRYTPLKTYGGRYRSHRSRYY